GQQAAQPFAVGGAYERDRMRARRATEERALEVDADDGRERLDLRDRLRRLCALECRPVLVEWSGHERRAVRGHPLFELRVPGAAPTVGVGGEEVDVANAVDLEVDEPGCEQRRAGVH